MKLYDTPLAPNPRRVRMFLAEKGIDIPREEINLIDGRRQDRGLHAVEPDAVGAGARAR